MKGSGCYNCPVKGCTAAYRGSRCAHLRELAGIDTDPKTNADRIRSMSDEELALFQARRYAQSVFLDKEKDGVILTGAAKEAFIADLYHVWLRYLKQPAEED